MAVEGYDPAVGVVLELPAVAVAIGVAVAPLGVAVGCSGVTLGVAVMAGVAVDVGARVLVGLMVAVGSGVLGSGAATPELELSAEVLGTMAALVVPPVIVPA